MAQTGDTRPKPPRSVTPIADLEQAVLIARTRALAQGAAGGGRIFLPRELGRLHAGWRLKATGAALALAAMLLAATLMRELAARLPPEWAIAAMAALALAAMLLGVRAWVRAWRRERAREQDEDETRWPGWWLDVDARRLVPHRQPRLRPIELGDEDFSLGLAGGGGGQQPFRFVHLQLRHPRRGTVAELCTWRLHAHAMQEGVQEEADAAIAELALALAARMGWRCRLPEHLRKFE